MTDTWTEADFDSLGWHDCHVHGLRILDGDHGAGQLWLDLDYILEWLHPATEGSNFRFRIAPAVLKFRDVTSLRLSLDYAMPAAAMGPFALGGIEREPVTYPTGYQSYRWPLNVNSTTGEISIEKERASQSD